MFETQQDLLDQSVHSIVAMLPTLDGMKENRVHVRMSGYLCTVDVFAMEARTWCEVYIVWQQILSYPHST